MKTVNFISKRTHNPLKRALAVLLVVSFLLPLAGCSLKDSWLSETQTKKAVDPVSLEETSERSSFIEEPTTMGDKEVAELAKYDNYIDEMQKRGMFDRTTEKSLTDEEHDTLIARFYEICERKGFSEEAVLLAKDTLEALCQNYRASQKGYIDMPGTIEYINKYYLSAP